MPYCDPHGWEWEPGRGPSPCVGETLSFLLAVCGCSCSYLSGSSRTVQQRAASAGSSAATVHGAQIALSLAQAVIALTGGVLSARPRGMLCGALVLHSLGWTLAWLSSAAAMSRSPRSCRVFVWWWLAGAVSNSVVLSSLHHASEREGHGVPAEIGFLSWLSFFGNALLVLLQLGKPELDDAESVYMRVLDGDTVVSASPGWQGFWAGGDALGLHAGGAAGHSRSRSSSGGPLSWLSYCCCCCCCCFDWLWSRDVGAGNEEALEGGGAWPIAGVEAGNSGALNEALLGAIGLEGSSRHGGTSPFKAKGRRTCDDSDARARRGFFRRIGRGLSAMAERGGKASPEQQFEGEGSRPRGDSFRRSLGGASALAVGVGTASRPTRARDTLGRSPSYSVACAPRAPPQAAAPVFGVSVTRWRLVDADGVPSAHGSPSEVVWTDRSTERSIASSSSAHTATLSASEVAAASVMSMDVHGDAGQRDTPKDDALDASATPPRAQLELLVRTSGRGEMDWWGRGDADSNAAPANGAVGGSATGDWRVWRSATDVLALYDALALRFGQEFCGRVPRPQLKTAMTSGSTAGHKRGEEASSPSGGQPTPGAPHRVDILRDARTVGAFMRSLLGQRRFLSTAVMDFLARPPPAAPAASSSDATLTSAKGVQLDDLYGDADRQSWDSDGGSDDSEDDRVPPPRVKGYAGGSRRPFASGETGVSAAGEAVAVAALASDYGAWLKRLAVRLRRATPAGDRFVRLRRIGPAVTGEQVVWWLVTSSGECRGDRASAVRLGQDMVSHGLLTPLCAGYDRAENPAAAGAAGKGRYTGNGGSNSGGRRDLLRSFDDAVGWLFAYVGDALRDPFGPPPLTEVAVMTGSPLDVRVTDWIETSDDQGAHVSFVVHIEVEATQEAWDAPRRYREFTQLRKRLLRLGINIPTAAAARSGGDESGGGGGDGRAATLAPDLPKKTWRSNKFDKDHLMTRRVALEAYLRAAVEAAIATPHLAGPLIMRFLDPDESNLRLLTGQNPFGSRPRAARGVEGHGRGGGSGDGGDGGRGGSMSRAVGETGHHTGKGGESVGVEDQAEAEDFNTLTDSLGGFG